MHKIRKQARRHAWYQDGAETNLNPFAKHSIRLTQSHSDHEDLESGLAGRPSMNVRSTSESQYRSAAEDRRQSTFGRANRAFSDQPSGPNAASGASYGLPPISSSSQSPRSQTFEQTTDLEKENQAPRSVTGDLSSSTETNGTDAQLISKAKEPAQQQLEQIETNRISVSDDSGKPRRRFIGGLLGRGKKSKDESEDGGDVVQSETAKSRRFKEPKFTVWSQIRNTLFNSPINILLVAVPVGIILYGVDAPPPAIFAVNFIAIIPLAALLSFATEEIALRTGETLGGLLNASFGNATELIVSIIALFQGEIIITQTSLIGSMLSNLLLVLGMCFFFGGMNRTRQHFNITVAQTASSLLALALAGLIVPTVFDVQTTASANVDITSISRGVSILLLLVYGAYLFFQLHTHADIYNEPSQKEPKKSIAKGEASKGMANVVGLFGSMAPNEVRNNITEKDPGEEEQEEAKLNIWVAVATLVLCTVLIGVNSEFMVDALDPITAGPHGISKTFVGLILIPIVGNAAEHATAVTVACKDKMDLAIGVAVGSSMQIALLVLPLVVVIGWIADKPQMNLDFDTFQVVILFISVLLVNYLIADGESHWLEGAQLMILYIIIATASWYYPQPCTPSAYFCPTS